MEMYYRLWGSDDVYMDFMPTPDTHFAEIRFNQNLVGGIISKFQLSKDDLNDLISWAKEQIEELDA